MGRGGGTAHGLGGTEPRPGFGGSDCDAGPLPRRLARRSAASIRACWSGEGPAPEADAITVSATGRHLRGGGAGRAGRPRGACTTRPRSSRAGCLRASPTRTVWSGEGNDEISLAEGFPDRARSRSTAASATTRSRAPPGTRSWSVGPGGAETSPAVPATTLCSRAPVATPSPAGTASTSWSPRPPATDTPSTAETATATSPASRRRSSQGIVARLGGKA